MKILFIYYIPPSGSNLFVLLCSLRSILDANLLYVLFTSMFILSSLSPIKYSKVVQTINTGVKVGCGLSYNW